MPFNKLNHSVLGEIRPRFRLKPNLSVQEVKEIVSEELSEDNTVMGNVEMKYTVVRIPQRDQHYWSPELQLYFEKDYDSDDTIIRCLIGPKQAVWAMFMFFYAAVAIATLFLGMYGLVQMQLDKFSATVYMIPVGFIILPTIYIFSKIGQKKGHEQMMHLVSFLYHTIDSKAKVERIEL